jgi:hypothetical protein
MGREVLYDSRLRRLELEQRMAVLLFVPVLLQFVIERSGLDTLILELLAIVGSDLRGALPVFFVLNPSESPRETAEAPPAPALVWRRGRCEAAPLRGASY